MLNLNYLATGAIEQLRKVGKEQFVTSEQSLTRVFHHMANKYTKGYSEEDREALLVDAFTWTFCIKLIDNFKSFSGFYCERDITIESYIMQVYGRALINAGKQFINKRKNEEGAVDSEGNDKLDYIGSYKHHNLGTLQMECEYIQDRIDFIEDRIDSVSKPLQKKYNAELDRLYNKLDRLENGFTNKETDDGVFELDEELSFRGMADELLSLVKDNAEEYDAYTVASLEMLIEGFSPVEIQKYLEIDKFTMDTILNDFKENLINMSEIYPEMLKELSDYTFNGEDFSTSISTMRSRDIKEDVINAFGFNIKEYVN